jgi:hypothetical protein
VRFGEFQAAQNRRPQSVEALLTGRSLSALSSLCLPKNPGPCARCCTSPVTVTVTVTLSPAGGAKRLGTSQFCFGPSHKSQHAQHRKEVLSYLPFTTPHTPSPITSPRPSAALPSTPRASHPQVRTHPSPPTSRTVSVRSLAAATVAVAAAAVAVAHRPSPPLFAAHRQCQRVCPALDDGREWLHRVSVSGTAVVSLADGFAL